MYTGKVIDYYNQIPSCDFPESRTIILRLDDVKAWQYYDITVNMASLILSKDMTVTLGVIPKDIEKDAKIFLPWINPKSLFYIGFRGTAYSIQRIR